MCHVDSENHTDYYVELSVWEGRVLSVKPKRLHLDKNESRRSRSAAEQNPVMCHVTWCHVIVTWY